MNLEHILSIHDKYNSQKEKLVDLKSLDASVKKNTSFIKKLRSIAEPQRESLLLEFSRLNLSRYVSEIVDSILPMIQKGVDTNSALEIICAVGARYPDFLTDLADRLLRSLKEFGNHAKATIAKQRQSGLHGVSNSIDSSELFRASAPQLSLQHTSSTSSLSSSMSASSYGSSASDTNALVIKYKNHLQLAISLHLLGLCEDLLPFCRHLLHTVLVDLYNVPDLFPVVMFAYSFYKDLKQYKETMHNALEKDFTLSTAQPSSTTTGAAATATATATSGLNLPSDEFLYWLYLDLQHYYHIQGSKLAIYHAMLVQQCLSTISFNPVAYMLPTSPAAPVSNRGSQSKTHFQRSPQKSSQCSLSLSSNDLASPPPPISPAATIHLNHALPPVPSAFQGTRPSKIYAKYIQDHLAEHDHLKSSVSKIDKIVPEFMADLEKDPNVPWTSNLKHALKVSIVFEEDTLFIEDPEFDLYGFSASSHTNAGATGDQATSHLPPEFFGPGGTPQLWNSDEIKSFYVELIKISTKCLKKTLVKTTSATVSKPCLLVNPPTKASASNMDMSSLFINNSLALPLDKDFIPNMIKRFNKGMNMDTIDQISIKLLSRPLKKAEREKLCSQLLDVPLSKLQWVPYYARLAANLNQVYPDIGASLISSLEGEYKRYLRLRSQLNYDHKLKTVRWVAELTKFNIMPKRSALIILRSLIHIFSYHYIDLIYLFLDYAGKYLFNHPGSHHEMRRLIETIYRKKSLYPLEDRQNIELENAIYSISPPLYLLNRTTKTKPKSLIQLYYEHLIYETLSESTLAQVSQILLMLPWNATTDNQALYSCVSSKIRSIVEPALPKENTLTKPAKKEDDNNNGPAAPPEPPAAKEHEITLGKKVYQFLPTFNTFSDTDFSSKKSLQVPLCSGSISLLVAEVQQTPAKGLHNCVQTISAKKGGRQNNLSSTNNNIIESDVSLQQQQQQQQQQKSSSSLTLANAKSSSKKGSLSAKKDLVSQPSKHDVPAASNLPRPAPQKHVVLNVMIEILLDTLLKPWKLTFENIGALARLVATLSPPPNSAPNNPRHPYFGSILVDLLLLDIERMLMREYSSNNQKGVTRVKYLMELYKLKFLTPTQINRFLASLIGPSQQKNNARMSPQWVYYRIRLVCIVLESLSKNKFPPESSKKKISSDEKGLQSFLTEFYAFATQRAVIPLPPEISFILRDALKAIHVHDKWVDYYESALQAYHASLNREQKIHAKADQETVSLARDSANRQDYAIENISIITEIENVILDPTVIEGDLESDSENIDSHLAELMGTSRPSTHQDSACDSPLPPRATDKDCFFMPKRPFSIMKKKQFGC